MLAANMVEDVSTLRIYDSGMIRDLMSQMGPTVAEDAVSIEQWTPDLKSTCWLLVQVGFDIVALHKLEALNTSTVELHANVLPAHRGQHRHKSIWAMFHWILDQYPCYEKVNATIPVVYPHIKRFAHEVGFRLEGIDRHSFRVNGQIVDRWRMGITADEIRMKLDELTS